MPSDLEVFISYSHCDVDWLKSLKVVLKPLERESQLISWCDQQIEAGEDIDKKALGHLDTAKIILLLVSPDFLASDYCYSIEMKGAMEKHAKGAARVIPVILRHCDWKGTDLGRLKAVPKDGKPVSTWADRDEAFMDIINELRRSLSSISTAAELEMASHSARILPMVESRGVLSHQALPEGKAPLRFSAVSDPVRIRNEGMTELVGDIFIHCTYDGTTTPQQPLGFGLKISFGTNVTSRSYSRSGSRPVIGGDPVLFEVGRPSAPAFISCSKVERNLVVFDHIVLDYLQPGEKRIFRVSNIRCNASGLGSGLLGPDDTSIHQVVAAVSITGHEFPTQVVATLANGLRFQVMPADRSGKNGFAVHALEPMPLQRIASLRFIEGFPNAFKSRLVSNGNTWAVGKAGKVYFSESCPFGPIVQFPDGRVISTGLADYGTRFQAHFTNIPVGIRLYASSTQVGGSISAYFVGNESSVKTTATMIIDGVVVHELSLQDGLAMAVWEVDSMPDRGWLAGEAYSEFAIFCGYEGPPLLGTGNVGGSIAPSPSPSHFTASAGATSNDFLPLPRFMDTSTAHPLLRVL